MKERLAIIWKNLFTSYWFIPSLMISGVWIVLGLMLRIDAHLTTESWVLNLSWIHIGTIDGARQLLVSIVGSLITVIGLLFSMTMVVFTLASSQYGPQVMRHFLGDRVTQIVLGTFVSTFIYCLLTLRSIGGGGETVFIPHISITFALFLTLISLCMLIYFIHHVSVRIQPQSIIKDLGDELSESLSRLFPEKLGKDNALEEEKHTKQKLLELFKKEGMSVYSTKGGYVQAIANEDMMNITEEQQVKIWLNVMPGEFIIEGVKIATIYPEPQNHEKFSQAINETVIVGSQRTSHQDIKYAIERMVEIAVRALSPGINEPFVSIMCIDYLSLALNHLSQRSIPSSLRFNENKEISIITGTIGFKDVLGTAFDQILHYGVSNPMIQDRVKHNLSKIKNLTDYSKYQSDIDEYIKQLAKKEKEKSCP